MLAACKAQEEGGNGGDSDTEDDMLVEPCPTHHDACQASSTMRTSRYFEHIDDPIACKVEEVLASFGCLMRVEKSKTLATTKITDYFPSN